MSYDTMLDVVSNLYLDLKKKRENLRKKKQKLDAEVIFLEKGNVTFEIREEVIKKQRKTGDDLYVIEEKIRAVEEGMSGGASLDAYFHEMGKVEE